jgi:hypothetical protein
MNITFTHAIMSKPTHIIVADQEGFRFVKLSDGRLIPADIAALAAGKDRWISEIKVKCRDCKKQFPISVLHCGGQYCEPCAEKGIE